MEEKTKKEKLASLKNEVKDFHPLLKILFPKLPHVKEVEHTHGPNEKGADFIITKYDETLDDVQYIGVVVKCGKITTNTTEIERQIDECALDRFIQNGKKKIFLNDVWVITNETISSNAQEKIHGKFANRSITFLGENFLIKQLDRFMPHYWYELPTRTGEYLRTIRLSNAKLDASLNLLPSVKDEQIYIEPDILEVTNIYNPKTKLLKRVRVNPFEYIENHSFIIMEGFFGAGKSKFLRKVIDHYTNIDKFITQRMLPVSCKFQDLIKKHNGDIQGFIDSEIGTLSEELKDTTILVLIDGLDEKKMSPDEQASLIDDIEKLIKDPKYKVILTSRNFNNLAETATIKNKAKKLEIAPLTMTKIITFISKMCSTSNISSRLIEDVRKSQLFKQLPRSPIAAILLASLINEKEKELPANMTELYSKYLELMLGRWDIEKGLQSQKEYEAARNVVMTLAEFILDNQVSFVSKSLFRSITENYITKRNTDVDTDELVEKIVSRSGIVTYIEEEDKLFFKHRSIAEFFYASLKKEKSSLSIDSRIYEPYWMNAFFFYIGLYKDCPDLLDQITKVAPTNEYQQWLRLINLPNYYLAGSSSPYEIVSDNIPELMVEAANLYREITQKKFQSIFSGLNEMHLLWLTQTIIRESYSYSFFKNAFEYAQVKIDDSASISTEDKAFAQFFIAVTNSDLETDKPYDYMLKSFGNSLPPQIMLAIGHETQNKKEISDLVDRQLKRFKKIRRDNHSLNDAIAKLYNLPINKKTSVKQLT